MNNNDDIKPDREADNSESKVQGTTNATLNSEKTGNDIPKIEIEKSDKTDSQNISEKADLLMKSLIDQVSQPSNPVNPIKADVPKEKPLEQEKVIVNEKNINSDTSTNIEKEKKQISLPPDLNNFSKSKPVSESKVVKKRPPVVKSFLLTAIVILITLPVIISIITNRSAKIEQGPSCAADDENCLPPGPYATIPGPEKCTTIECCKAYKDMYYTWDGNKCSKWIPPNSQCTGNWGSCHLWGCICLKTKYCTEVINGQPVFTSLTCDSSECEPCDDDNPPNNKPKPPGVDPTPTLTQFVCQNIKIYKTDGTDITESLRAGTSGVNPGDTIVIGVLGENAAKARVRVRGSQFQETSTKNNKGEFVLNVQLQQSVIDYTIEAEVYSNGVWK